MIADNLLARHSATFCSALNYRCKTPAIHAKDIACHLYCVQDLVVSRSNSDLRVSGSLT